MAKYAKAWELAKVAKGGPQFVERVDLQYHPAIALGIQA